MASEGVSLKCVFFARKQAEEQLFQALADAVEFLRVKNNQPTLELTDARLVDLEQVVLVFGNTQLEVPLEALDQGPKSLAAWWNDQEAAAEGKKRQEAANHAKWQLGVLEKLIAKRRAELEKAEGELRLAHETFTSRFGTHPI